MKANHNGRPVTDADKKTLDDLETKVLPVLERESATVRQGDYGGTVWSDARVALAALQPCLQLAPAHSVPGEAPVIQNANVMRRAQEVQRRLQAIIMAVSERTRGSTGTGGGEARDGAMVAAVVDAAHQPQ